MVDMNPLINLARMAVIGVVSVFSLINLGISAHIIWATGGRLTFAPLTLVTAILTLLTLPAMYFVSVTRNGAFPSKIVVEIAWFWFLWIMWIASAGTASSFWFYGGTIAEHQATQAFSFLNWLALMFYTTTLFILSIVAHVKGSQGVWTSTVKDFDFSAAINKSAGGVGVVPAVGGFSAPQYDQKTGGTMSTVPTGNFYPPQQPGTPQQVPQQIPQQVPQQYSGYAGQPVQQQPQVAIV